MPAKFVKSYAAPDGTIFATLIEEQAYELNKLIDACEDKASASLASLILDHREEVLAILTQRERQRVREAKPRRGRPAKPTTTPAATP